MSRLLAAVVTFCIAAAAVYLAVRLILAIWVPLVIIIGVSAALYGSVAWLRSRNTKW